MKRAFVTGGTGFIGSHLTEQLIDNGYKVNVLVRQKSDLSSLPLDKVDLIWGDINDVESLRSGMKDCDQIFHVAAKVSDWGEYEDFFQVNVIGTKNILDAALHNGINKIIYVSSNAVLGEEDCLSPKSEESPYNPIMLYLLSNIFESGMNHYRQTKMLAEKEAIAFAKENNISLTILRPVWVYGPREFNAGPFEFCQQMLQRIRVAPAGADNRFHVIYVKDLVTAIILAAKKDLNGVNIFNIGNSEAPKLRDYLNKYCEYLKVKPPIYVPIYLVYPLGILLESVAKIFRSQRSPLLTRARVKMFYCNNIYAVSKAEKELGFKADTSLDDGIKETVSWWRRNGYLGGERHVLKQQNVTGLNRVILDLKIGTSILLKYFMRLIGREISFKQYFYLIWRVCIFSSVLKKYKAVKINGRYKLHIYLAAYPSKAFFRAIDKFLCLNGETVASHVVLSMTKACGYNCQHCYQRNDGEPDMPLEVLIRTAKNLQDLGITMFDIEGGEPLLRFDRTINLLENLDNRSELWINTTGHTLTDEKALRLKQVNLFGAMISIHHWQGEKHDAFVGKKGAFQIAITAIKMFHRAGITTAINCVPSTELVNDGGIEHIMQLAKELNCSYVQVIHEKPTGAWLFRGNSLMEPCLLKKLRETHVNYNTLKRYKDFPSLGMQVFDESCKDAFGCTAGGIERFYINAAGEMQPCEFLSVSVGNVKDEDFMTLYKRMRDLFKKPSLKWLCNSESGAIARCSQENGISSFPLKKDIALKLISTWDKGEDVPLFKRMKMCEKV